MSALIHYLKKVLRLSVEDGFLALLPRQLAAQAKFDEQTRAFYQTNQSATTI